MPTVSVIIPVYNAQEYVAATLETVFSQTFRDFEVIVIDDGSTDRTNAILEGFHDKIKLLRNAHKGPAASRNLGLEASCGSLIAFLDSDDLWLPEKLERQVSIASSFPEYGIITTDMAKFDTTGIFQPSSTALRRSIPTGWVLEELLFDNWIGASCAMARRECFEKVGKFCDDSIGLGKEDWNMWVRIAAHYPIYYLDEVLAHIRVHPQSLSHQNEKRHLAACLAQLDWLEESVPRLRAQHELMQQARFSFCWQVGWDAVRIPDPESARDSLQRALRYSPYNAKAWTGIAVTHLPVPVLRFLKSAARVTRRNLSSSKKARTG